MHASYRRRPRAARITVGLTSRWSVTGSTSTTSPVWTPINICQAMAGAGDRLYDDRFESGSTPPGTSPGHTSVSPL